ncbi:IS110 family transposase [Agrobacterium salinitolerans]|nr:IS110 family transposase [Agrobacterium salinitolerans]
MRALAEERDKPDEQNPSVEKKRKMLIQLRGIGAPSAAILAREVFGRTFSNRKQLGSYLGLTPSAYDSGSTTRCQGISKAGNKAARRIMVELAWLWVRYQPQAGLTRWFLTRSAGQSPRLRRVLVVALSRKLIVALWRYVETGLVPDGAILSEPSSNSDGVSSMA